MPEIHPAVAAILRWFDYDHLPPHLKAVSAPFADLANELVANLGGTEHGAELTTALRKLLESKDCAVRAALGCDPAGLVDPAEAITPAGAIDPIEGPLTRDALREAINARPNWPGVVLLLGARVGGFECEPEISAASMWDFLETIPRSAGWKVAGAHADVPADVVGPDAWGVAWAPRPVRPCVPMRGSVGNVLIEEIGRAAEVIGGPFEIVVGSQIAKDSLVEAHEAIEAEIVVVDSAAVAAHEWRVRPYTGPQPPAGGQPA